METDPLTPEERRTFDELAEIVLDELRAQISVHRLDSQVMDLVRAEGELRRDDDEGDRATAVLIADAVWSYFDLNRRSEPLR